MASHRVVVIGSGFGGLFATRALRGAPVDVTLIDRTNHHLFQPLLYQVATGILSPGEIAPATRDVLQRQANAEVLIGEVVDIDVARRVVVSEVLGQQTTTPYDSLIISAGSTSSYFGHDDFAANAPTLKSVDDALELRGRIFGAFEMAELETDADRRRRWLTFVVVGGGATGVEMAGQIAELSRRTLRHNFRTFDPADARVLLVEGGHEILAGFGDRLSKSAVTELEHLGVKIHLGALVTNLDETGVDIKTDDPNLERIDAMVKVWAAGVRGASIGSLLADQAGATLERSGRVQVQPDCTLAGRSVTGSSASSGGPGASGRSPISRSSVARRSKRCTRRPPHRPVTRRRGGGRTLDVPPSAGAGRSAFSPLRPAAAGAPLASPARLAVHLPLRLPSFGPRGRGRKCRI